MVNFLFTNIPFKECIDLTVSYIIEGNTKLKLSKADLTRLFTIATAETRFVFNRKVYDQIDGVAMGSPIAPVLANLFLGHYEKLWLNMYKCPSVHFYRRYVEDTFCLFNNEDEALLFFEFLNSQLDSIKFTMEKEANNTLAFLDVFINNKDPTNLITSVDRKKISTGLLINSSSFTSISYKLGLIRTLFDRVYKISNTLFSFNEEVRKLSYIFKKNQFPEGLINKVLNRYHNKVNKSTALPVDSRSPDGLCTLYFKLPYLTLSTPISLLFYFVLLLGSFL